MSSRRDVLVPAATLSDLTRDCFGRLGLSVDDASIVADVLVDANLRGISSHGFQRVPIYARRVHLGLAGGSDRISVVTSFASVCQLNAGGCLGPVVAVKAVDKATALARKYGMGLVVLGGSTHFGPAGYYGRRAALQGCVAMVMANAPKTMAPFGASERFVGTDPLAIAIPLERHADFVLDVATSVVARGKIIQWAQVGEAIPPGLAIDSEGRPTTDAKAALAGSVLPFAGPKGSGLALAIGMLTAVLGGADFDDELASMYEDFDRPQNVGHLFLVIDPWCIGERETGQRRWDAFIDRLGALAPAEGHDAVHYPGELEAGLAEQRKVEGIPINAAELKAFVELCDELGFNDLSKESRCLIETKGAGA